MDTFNLWGKVNGTERRENDLYAEPVAQNDLYAEPVAQQVKRWLTDLEVPDSSPA